MGHRGIFIQGNVAPAIGSASLSSIDNSGTIEGTSGTAIEFDTALVQRRLTLTVDV